MQFINPLTGGHAMPTIGTFMQLLPKGFRSRPYRSTDGTVYSVAEGTGSVQIGGERFAFEARDTFVVPSWMPATLETSAECVLFSFSDRPCQETLACGESSADERARQGVPRQEYNNRELVPTIRSTSRAGTRARRARAAP